MVLILMQFTTLLWQMKKHQLFRYIDGMKQPLGPSIGKFLFSLSYNFEDLLSIQNQLILLFYFHLTANSNSSNLYAKWEQVFHEDSSSLWQYLKQVFSFAPSSILHFFGELTTKFLLHSIKERLQSLGVLYTLLKT